MFYHGKNCLAVQGAQIDLGIGVCSHEIVAVLKYISLFSIYFRDILSFALNTYFFNSSLQKKKKKKRNDQT